jgi:hypothetical protein
MYSLFVTNKASEKTGRSKIATCSRHSPPRTIEFCRVHGYALLLHASAAIRQRHLPFLEIAVPNSAALISAFRSGDSMFWSNLAVRDLTR